MKIAISQMQLIQDTAEITTGKVTIRATALIGAKFVSEGGSRNHAALTQTTLMKNVYLEMSSNHSAVTTPNSNLNTHTRSFVRRKRTSKVL